MHMSGIAEPIPYYMKRFGVVEQTYKGAVTKKIIEASRKMNVTPELLFSETIFPWCHCDGFKCPKHAGKAVYIGHFSNEIKLMIESSIPDIVRKNPNRYPFLLPGNASSSRGGLFDICSKEEWLLQCKK